MKRLGIAVGLLASLFGLVSCFQKRYVGLKVNYNPNVWCRYDASANGGEKSCYIDLSKMVLEFAITKGPNPGEYIVEGTMDPTKGEFKSWSHILDKDTHFNIIIAKDGIVVDNVTFRPVTAFGELKGKLPFKIHLNQPNGFDAVTFTGEITMRG